MHHIELGGTVGDIESAPFIEAMRQFQFRVGHDNFCLIHVSLVPVVGAVGEQKTKPTQSSVRELRGLGLSPDLVTCRATDPLGDEIRNKLSMFCQVTPSQVFSVHDCESTVPYPTSFGEAGNDWPIDQAPQLGSDHHSQRDPRGGHRIVVAVARIGWPTCP